MNCIFPFSLFFWFCPFLFLSRSLSFQLRKRDWDLLHYCLLVGEVATEHRKVLSLPPRLISLLLQLPAWKARDSGWWLSLGQYVSGSSYVLFCVFFWFKSFLCLINFLLISWSYGAAPVNLNIKAGGRAYGSSGKKIYIVILVKNKTKQNKKGLFWIKEIIVTFKTSW